MRIDPFGVHEPWRRYVQGALQAQARWDRAVGLLPAGPMRERLEEIGRRIEEASRECWRIAQQGNALDDAVATLDVSGVRGRLATSTEVAVATGSDEERIVASLRAQLGAAERMTAVVADARRRLALLGARLDEAVATALALSALGDHGEDTGRLRSDIDLVVEDLAALSSALEETGRLGT